MSENPMTSTGMEEEPMPSSSKTSAKRPASTCPEQNMVEDGRNESSTPDEPCVKRKKPESSSPATKSDSGVVKLDPDEDAEDQYSLAAPGEITYLETPAYEPYDTDSSEDCQNPEEVERSVPATLSEIVDPFPDSAPAPPSSSLPSEPVNISLHVSKGCRIGPLFDEARVRSLPSSKPLPYPEEIARILRNLISCAHRPCDIFDSLKDAAAEQAFSIVMFFHRANGKRECKNIPVADSVISARAWLSEFLESVGCCKNLFTLHSIPDDFICTHCFTRNRDEKGTDESEEMTKRAEKRRREDEEKHKEEEKLKRVEKEKRQKEAEDERLTKEEVKKETEKRQQDEERRRIEEEARKASEEIYNNIFAFFLYHLPQGPAFPRPDLETLVLNCPALTSMEKVRVRVYIEGGKEVWQLGNETPMYSEILKEITVHRCSAVPEKHDINYNGSMLELWLSVLLSCPKCCSESSVEKALEKVKKFIEAECLKEEERKRQVEEEERKTAEEEMLDQEEMHAAMKQRDDDLRRREANLDLREEELKKEQRNLQETDEKRKRKEMDEKRKGAEEERLKMEEMHAKIKEKEEEMKKREAELERKEEELQKVQQQLKEVNLEEMHTEMKLKEEELKKREGELERKEEELQKMQQQLEEENLRMNLREVEEANKKKKAERKLMEEEEKRKVEEKRLRKEERKRMRAERERKVLEWREEEKKKDQKLRKKMTEEGKSKKREDELRLLKNEREKLELTKMKKMSKEQKEYLEEIRTAIGKLEKEDLESKMDVKLGCKNTVELGRKVIGTWLGSGITKEEHAKDAYMNINSIFMILFKIPDQRTDLRPDLDNLIASECPGASFDHFVRVNVYLDDDREMWKLGSEKAIDSSLLKEITTHSCSSVFTDLTTGGTLLELWHSLLLHCPRCIRTDPPSWTPLINRIRKFLKDEEDERWKMVKSGDSE